MRAQSFLNFSRSARSRSRLLMEMQGNINKQFLGGEQNHKSRAFCNLRRIESKTSFHQKRLIIGRSLVSKLRWKG